MPQPTTWILIADAAHGRLFAAHRRAEPWTLVRELAHPPSRARVREIMAGKAGRVQQRVGTSRSAADPRTPPKTVEAERFARELVAALQDGLDRGACQRLVLVAPPHFLGLLRQCASDDVRAAIEASVDHDWIDVAERDLPARLSAALP